MTDTLADIMMAICTEPADDTVRLAYADAYDEAHERATERAEFIRVQVELSKTPKMIPPGQLVWSKGGVIIGKTIYEVENPKWKKLAKRDQYLLEETHESKLCYNHTAWAGEVATLVLPFNAAKVYRFTRGFVSSVTCTAADWLKNADTIYWHPNKRVKCDDCDGRGEVRFCDAAGDMDDEPCVACGGNLRGGYNRGKGWVHAPFVATAQPITEVTITDFVRRDSSGRSNGNLWNEFELYAPSGSPWRSHRWPGIWFHTPNGVAGHVRWNGNAGDGDFQNPGNWEGGVAPGPADTAIV